MNKKEYGYPIASGYKGLMPDGRWQKFEDEGAYKELFNEELKEEEES